MLQQTGARDNGGGLKLEAKMHFRDELRAARAETYRDAEAFDKVLFAIERLGSFIARKIGTLKTYESHLQQKAILSPLAEDIPKQLPDWHAPFSALYALLIVARNEALHQGAVARHLTAHAVELCIILEDALMTDVLCARDFMVTNPVCAHVWEPISSIRRTMLINAFSYLPVLLGTECKPTWHLISDLAIAKYLHNPKNNGDRKTLLVADLEKARDGNGMFLIQAETCNPNDEIVSVLPKLTGAPILVVDKTCQQKLRGLIMPFDVL